ncbi:MAG TPA: hypothetical protein VMU65_13780 [Candidatus Saccharimonadales bacterium]|nr:hypothetical protein [Candidatus Saccharimonadales bacterium]
MGRPIGGVAALIAGATAVGLLLSGCSSSTGMVIGVPNVVPPATPTPGTLFNAISQAVENEISQVNAAGDPAGESATVVAELNALNNIRSLYHAQALEALLATANKQITKRVAYVNALIADVAADKYLSGIDVSGRSLTQSVISLLNGVNTQLEALASKIVSDQLADQLRTDVLSIGPSSRIYGVYEPMTHLVIAAGDELDELNTLAGQESQLQAQVATGQGTDANYSSEAAALRDLSSSIAAGRAVLGTDISEVLRMTPSNYPANKTTVTAVRSAVIQLRSPQGEIGKATADSSKILELIAQR